MARALLVSPALEALKQQMEVMDGFNVVDTTKWTANVDTNGTVGGSDAIGGIASIATGATDNKVCSLHTVKECFNFIVNRPIRTWVSYQYQEVSTNTTNAYIGLMNAFATAPTVANGAGPKATGSALGFVKVDGGLNWKVHYQVNGASQATVELTAANSLTKAACPGATASGVYAQLETEWIPTSATLCNVIWKINGSTVYKLTDATYASPVTMNFGFVSHAGTGTATTVLIDACYAGQRSLVPV